MIDGLAHAGLFPDSKHEYSMAAFKLLREAKVPILAGTDIGYPYSPLLHAELEIMVADGGFLPIQALAAATANTADAYRLKDRGRIQSGMRADLLLVSGDPTKSITDTRRIEAVWVQGVKVDRGGYKSKIPGMKAPPQRGPGPPPPKPENRGRP